MHKGTSLHSYFLMSQTLASRLVRALRHWIFATKSFTTTYLSRLLQFLRILDIFSKQKTVCPCRPPPTSRKDEDRALCPSFSPVQDPDALERTSVHIPYPTIPIHIDDTTNDICEGSSEQYSVVAACMDPQPSRSPHHSRTSLASRVPTPLPEIPMNVNSTNDRDKNQLRPELCQVVDDLVAVAPTEYERYDRSVKLEVMESSYVIQPMTMTFPNTEPPQPWVAYTHPEGAVYFFDAKRDILTDAYINEEDDREDIEHYIAQIHDYLTKYDVHLPSDVQLVLELRGSGRCGYYFVDHSHKSVFWLDKFDPVDLLQEVKVDFTTSHIGSEMESQYWYHNELFPGVRHIPDNTVRDLKDMLIHAVGDSLTSQASTVSYTLDELQMMLGLVTKVQIDQGPESVGSACFLYRLMATFAHERFLNLHGERAARLNKDQSIHPKRQRTLFMNIVSPFLFYGSGTHLKKLEKMSVDFLVNKPSWSKLLQNLTEEWKEFILYATVLLNANVAFLAIQSVDSSPPHGSRSAVQRASYFSIVTSLGVIIVGLMLVRQHHTTLNMSFLANRSASSLGLEMLAAMYSLPYALLMWGMVSFLISFSLMCFGSGDLPTIVLTSVGWVALCLLLLWCTSVSYEKHAYYYPWLLRQWVNIRTRIREKIEESRGQDETDSRTSQA
ncbi:hypothetical protein BDQ12DRAFT_738201 [Crucibulum laeve]|uniref:WW domain-containing protein n=1 Tax=Crucibulum laeve TaxID=68775 RepID=A0A5C3LNY3_9AGAR|nr:hypothetical protein BDQ12DRAFT_738201 [Crucibulum laeve]